MMYFAFLFGFCFVFWMVGVSCNPSPYYGVLSLVIGAAFGCGLLVSMGGSFVSVVLFLIYLGGMLVIFAYSSALVEEPYPAAWGNRGGMIYVVSYVLVIVGYGAMCYWLWSMEGYGSVTIDAGGLFVVRLDFSGVAWFYYFGSWLFLIAGWGLLLTLFVVMELVRGLSCGVLRPI
uniref:NADH-ubiquinone oxidoreductase chain 6 n=1 Tax=Lepidochelys olivacea TaxID=27788 RepID=J7FY22_LEPOA|nr:NADH dehydrogenase subunit 6 [Lepidochelys olivacea]AFP52761.1 NADH dehydrogenase subunit 6 [Lepidochelys olivacea]AFP52864.1 NADH dehydrogenase subunit 6 [Lepidochelys olivacea]AFP52916.1 NADH dehydrogenase subunit 6 [Lepidochelys olivacea]